MKNKIWMDGWNKAKHRMEEGEEIDLMVLKEAFKDCQDLGWGSLRDYFLGQIDYIEGRKA